MIQYAVWFNDLTLPSRFSRDFARVAVRRALGELNVALSGLVQFVLLADLSGTAENRRITIEFAQAAEGTAELHTNEDGSHIVRLDPDAEWNLVKFLWWRQGAVDVETFIWHELGHIAGHGHSNNPQSIMAANPLPSRYLTKADRLLLRTAFEQMN
jgi:hypothetical protein